MEKTVEGFIQNLKGEEYNITYKIQNRNIYFKDSKNGFLIKISKLKG